MMNSLHNPLSLLSRILLAWLFTSSGPTPRKR